MEIKEALKKDKLIIGTKRTIKALRKEQIAKIFLANNCSELIEEDINHFASLDGVLVEKMDIACDELGVLCKKPFLVSVVGVLK